MIRRFATAIPFLTLVTCLLLFSPRGGACAEAAASDATVAPAEIEAVIKTLENPAAREELIRALKVMAQAQQPAKPESEVKSAAAQVLRGISKRVGGVTESIMAVAGTINEIPTITAWFKDQLTEPEIRRMWTEVLINLTLTLGLGYLGFYIVRFGLVRARRSASQKEPKNFLFRILRLLGILVIDLLPIVAFAIAAYLTLSIVSPREQTRLVALAWVNAFIISHSVIALLNFLLAPQSTSLRFSGLSDENANYLVIWGRRLTFATVYGYFALQAALLLGLPMGSYEVLLRLLGLLITALVIIMILQNRETVAHYIRQFSVEKETESETDTDSGSEPETGVEPEAAKPRPPGSQGLRKRLANVWHLLALFYVILLYGVWALRVPGGFLFLFRATLLTVVTLLIVRTVLRMLNAIFTKGFRVSDDLKSRFPGLEERANRYLCTLHKALKLGVYFLGAMTILQAWGMNTFGWLSSEPGKVLGGTIASVIGIILVTFLIWEIANSLIENSLTKKDANGTDLEASARTRTLLTVARKALGIVLTVVSTLMVLSEIGVNIGPLLAGAGVLGLAVGFGSQKLVQDVITGVFILLEDQIAVGDVIDLGGKAGVVEAVSIRTVRLRDLSGTVHTIPFSAISTVSNKTKDYSFSVMEVGVAYRESVDEVMEVLKEIGAELQLDPEYGAKILEPLEVLGVDAFADSAVVIKARIKTVPVKQWWVGREFNRRMKNKFDELDIEIPFPHQTVYFGVDKQGQAPPARFQVQSKQGGEYPALENESSDVEVNEKTTDAGGDNNLAPA